MPLTRVDTQLLSNGLTTDSTGLNTISGGNTKILATAAGTDRKVIFQNEVGTQATLGIGTTGSSGGLGTFYVQTNAGYSLNVDSSGRMTMPYQPSFHAHLNTTTTVGVTSTVIFNTKIFDTLTNYSTSTGRFTAPVTGLYQFNVSVLIDSSQAAVEANFRFRVNGSGVPCSLYFSRSRTSGYDWMTKSWCWKLTANDYVDLVTNASLTLFGNTVGSTDNQTHFSGYLVG
jgi:hypothetical protein